MESKIEGFWELINEALDLLDRIEAERNIAKQSFKDKETIKKYVSFGNKVRHEVEMVDSVENSNDKEWVYCFDMDSKYEIEVKKTRKITNVKGGNE